MRLCTAKTRHSLAHFKLLQAASGYIPTSSSLLLVPRSISSEHHPNIKITNIHSHRKGFLSQFPCTFRTICIWPLSLEEDKKLFSHDIWDLSLIISTEALTVSWSSLVPATGSTWSLCLLHALPLFHGILHKGIANIQWEEHKSRYGVFLKPSRRELWTVYNSNTPQHAPIQLKKWIIAEYIF